MDSYLLPHPYTIMHHGMGQDTAAPKIVTYLGHFTFILAGI
jgi:hypothetical protein